MSARGWLYKIARFMGDVEAVKKRRVARRVAGKATGALFRKIFK